MALHKYVQVVASFLSESDRYLKSRHLVFAVISRTPPSFAATRVSDVRPHEIIQAMSVFNNTLKLQQRSQYAV